MNVALCHCDWEKTFFLSLFHRKLLQSHLSKSQLGWKWMHVWSTWQFSTILEEAAAAMKLQLYRLPESPLNGKSLCLAYVTFATERNSWIRWGGMLIMHHKTHTHTHTHTHTLYVPFSSCLPLLRSHSVSPSLSSPSLSFSLSFLLSLSLLPLSPILEDSSQLQKAHSSPSRW